jgi:LysR family hydrogen peroxide-inducible transcriptional activator
LCTPSAPGVLRRQATGLETLRHLIAAGVGYSLLPTLAVRPGDELEGLVAYACIAPGPGDEAGSGRRITLVWRASDPRQLSLETLGSYLREATPAGMHPAGDARLTQRAE